MVRVVAADGNGRPVTAGPVAAEFWGPGRDPEHDLAVRAAPDHRVLCSYDSAARRWLARVDGRVTAGWAPGTWTVRGWVHGEPAGWGWATFGLAA
jgi:hypothetical protein